MERGFWIILFGIVVIALGYAALSVWPVLTAPATQPSELTAQGPGTPIPPSPRANPPAAGQSGVAAPQTGSGPPVSAPPGGPPAAATGSAQHSAPTSHAANRRMPSKKPAKVPPLLANAPKQDVEVKQEEQPEWKFAKRSAELFVEPNGLPHHSASLNNEPLVIARGSHLLPLEYRDGWVMVRSPGHTLGWLPADMVADIPPVSVVDDVID